MYLFSIEVKIVAAFAIVLPWFEPFLVFAISVDEPDHKRQSGLVDKDSVEVDQSL